MRAREARSPSSQSPETGRSFGLSTFSERVVERYCFRLRGSGCDFDGSAVSERLVLLARHPQAVHQHGELASYRHPCSLLGILPAPRHKAEPPTTEVAVASKWSEDVVGRVDEQSTQEWVAGFGDPQLWIAVPQLALARAEAEIRGSCAAALDTGPCRRGSADRPEPSGYPRPGAGQAPRHRADARRFARLSDRTLDLALNTFQGDVQGIQRRAQRGGDSTSWSFARSSRRHRSANAPRSS